MINFLVKRIFNSVLIIWGVVSITFFLIHLAPGDPVSLYTSPEISPKTIEVLRQQLGFHLPVWKQYFVFTKELLGGNLGISLAHKQQVIDIFFRVIPNTLQLTIVVFILQLLIGLSLGIIAAIKQGSRLDHAINNSLLIIYAVPGFWLALMAIYIFSYKLGWFPSSQMATIGISGGFRNILWDRITHMILPVAILAAPFAAYTARFIRGSFIEISRKQYIKNARAFGINKYRINFIYILKNALLPVSTLIGLYFPFLLGGAVITEYIFAWPGMGRLTIEAIFTHDYPVILASTIVAAVSVVLGNFVSDILYCILDPKIKIQNI